MSTPFGKLIKTDKSYENLNMVFEHGSIRYIEHEVYDYDHHDCIFGCFDNKPDDMEYYLEIYHNFELHETTKRYYILRLVNYIAEHIDEKDCIREITDESIFKGRNYSHDFKVYLDNSHDVNELERVINDAISTIKCEPYKTENIAVSHMICYKLFDIKNGIEIQEWHDVCFKDNASKRKAREGYKPLLGQHNIGDMILVLFETKIIPYKNTLEKDKYGMFERYTDHWIGYNGYDQTCPTVKTLHEVSNIDKIHWYPGKVYLKFNVRNGTIDIEAIQSKQYNYVVSMENVIKALDSITVKVSEHHEQYFEPAGIKDAMSKLYKLLEQYKADC